MTSHKPQRLDLYIIANQSFGHSLDLEERRVDVQAFYPSQTVQKGKPISYSRFVTSKHHCLSVGDKVRYRGGSCNLCLPDECFTVEEVIGPTQVRIDQDVLNGQPLGCPACQGGWLSVYPCDVKAATLVAQARPNHSRSAFQPPVRATMEAGKPFAKLEGCYLSCNMPTPGMLVDVEDAGVRLARIEKLAIPGNFRMADDTVEVPVSVILSQAAESDVEGVEMTRSVSNLAEFDVALKDPKDCGVIELRLSAEDAGNLARHVNWNDASKAKTLEEAPQLPYFFAGYWDLNANLMFEGGSEENRVLYFGEVYVAPSISELA